MSETVAIITFAVCSLVGLALIPLGLPGLWVMVLGVCVYGFLTDFRSVSAWTIGIVLGLALVGEVIESWLGFSYAKKYGGSSRSGWGALLGGIVGAILGVPVPVIGSIIGAFLGSFIGAVVFEFSYSRQPSTAVRAGWGSVIGRAAAAAMKMAIGLIVVVIGIFAIVRG
jgi:uncharacterized protein YqgC (DUF456 family)